MIVLSETSTLDFTIEHVKLCNHSSLPTLLVARGFFPSGPTLPGYAFSVDMLNLFLGLMRNGGNSVQSLAASLHEQHRNYGHVLRGSNGQPIQEGYRRTLQSALQWYDSLLSLLDDEIRERIANARQEILYSHTSSPPHSPRNAEPNLHGDNAADVPAIQSSAPATPQSPPCTPRRSPTRTSLILTSLSGGDFQCALDGNFSHRRNKKAGRCPDIRHQWRALVPKEFVDAVGDAIDDARAKPARRYESEVPAAALKQCESSHTAASGTQAKATGEIHDEKGLMALVCRHDVPLFFCNIDTPGEQQKYSMALLIWLMLHLPHNATVMNLYDIGCVADRVKNTVSSFGAPLAYDIMPAGMGDRIMFATSAMHAYAHQWECQLVFSPRMKLGLGLTDGEGVERLWSRLRKLIGHLRHVSKERRLIILDRHMEWIASKMRDDMGRWLSAKWKALVLRERSARAEVVQSGRSAEFLRRQWSEQREHQLNVRRLTPPRLRKELEAVMALQDNIESVEEAITSAEAAVKRCRRGGERVQSLARLEELRETHTQLTKQADALYSALNVEDTFPGVHDLGYDFVRALIMAYDAKCIARRKLIGRFFEWDYLDQASVGTHQHQRTVRAIQKRAPAIRNAIVRYNALCVQVRELLLPGRSFPLPEELPTDLTQLKHDPSLLEDVWIVNLPTGVAPWLTDQTVRIAIRAQLILDRCAEERIRLVREEKQLYNWLTLEAQAVVHALGDAESMSLFRMSARAKALAEAASNNSEMLPQCIDTIPPHYNDTARVAILAGDTAPDALDAVGHGLQTPPATPYLHRTSADAPDAAYDAALWSDDSASDDEMDADDLRDVQTATTDDAIVIESDDEDAPAVSYLDAPPPIILPTHRLVRPEQAGFKRVTVDLKALAALRTGEKVNDDIIYAGIAALTARFPRRADELAVLQTYEYRLWCDSQKIARLRSLLSHTEFWSCNVILLPIYSPQDEHWLLAVVYTQHRLIDFYDSFGSRTRWREHAPKVAALLNAMERDARSRKLPLTWDTSSSSWITTELVRFTSPHQENLVDCGIWVLAVVAAVLRGWRTTVLPASLVADFRQYLCRLICDYIPVSSAQ
ncbi:hypothetical protein AURDEDRAFT_67410 [Auricularia subglabra TFB-10046 SS5]|nr:hypothetical protein AURDEDRAFT_67410 [Auricularia subglabra TFB-10046 SS5]